MASDRGASQQTFDFGDEEEPTLPANLLRPEFTDPASVDTPSLNASTEMDLMEMIVHRYTLVRAWAQVKRNRGAPGPDGMTIQEFEGWCREHWPAVKQQLLDGTYRPSPVRRKTIPKEGGGERQLGIPNVLDRLIQQAICQVLTPIFDPGFSESSFGFRPGRSAHGAAKRVRQIIRQRHEYCVDVDLSKFFDRVQHDVLMNRVGRKVHDGRVLRLIGCYLRAGVMVNGVLQPTDEGAPQGGPLSPLLSNILLDDFDKELERRQLKFVRYADDFVIFVRSERSARRVLTSVQRYLTQHLKLVVNETKSSVGPSRGCEFLGFAFVGKPVMITAAPKKLTAFKGRIKELTGRSRGISMARRLTDLNRYLRGWIGYFGLARQLTNSSNSTAGSDAASGCAIGNNGVIPARSFETFCVWVWNRIWRSNRHSVVKAIGGCPRPLPCAMRCPTTGWSNKDCSRSNNSGATLLRFEEPPSANPHARWCGEGGQQ